jgi:hypothetical protein
MGGAVPAGAAPHRFARRSRRSRDGHGGSLAVRVSEIRLEDEGRRSTIDNCTAGARMSSVEALSWCTVIPPALSVACQAYAIESRAGGYSRSSCHAVAVEGCAALGVAMVMGIATAISRGLRKTRASASPVGRGGVVTSSGVLIVRRQES